MSTPSLLNDKLTEFSEWINNLRELDNESIKQYLNEIKAKGRTFIKFQAEVKLLNDDDLISKFSKLMIQFKNVKAIANGRAPPIAQETENEKKSQSPDPDTTSTSKTASCTMGKDCTSNDPKHYYDLIHFDHPKSDAMIWKHEKYLKKQKCQQIYDEHKKNTTKTDAPNVSSEFAQFLTDEELAQQLQAMQEMSVVASNTSNAKPKRVRNRTRIVYKEDDDDEGKESSSEDDDDDEDYDESEARRTYRRKVKNRKKEDERRKLEEDNMDEAELERLRQERLNKLLNKTEAYMKTLTRRVRKNANTNNSKKASALSTKDVKQFLEGDGAKTKAIEQTKSLIGGTLKDYQQIGLRWMVTLNQMRLNGILADEMGLGKTVQVLALLAYIFDNDEVRGKHLIVAPLSTLSSWRDHFSDWLPSLKVYLHRGPAAERKEKLIAISKGEMDADVVISTYQMVIRDAETLSNLKWCYLVVDEAHTLKNAQSRLFEALNAFCTKHRLLLTGTPLQNNLGELWSLLNFILPSIFDSAQSFESWFCSPFQHLHKKKDKDKSVTSLTMTDEERLMVMDRLHRAIDPFLLRRMKKDVLPKMVKKEEIVIKVAISGMQSAMYAQLQSYGAFRYKSESKRKRFNNIMMQLRKCANHPYLFAPDEYEVNEDIYRCSGKFVLLRHLIPKMKRFEHRILIFCQFVTTMDILAEFLELLSEPYLRIDGGTDSEDRMDYLDEFNTSDAVSIFLLSTRACGLGLNLYSADTVILFDSDWNPQQDLQAMARCHRIGQKKEVRVFRLIADGTIEESIYDRAQKKLDLERKAIECGKFDFSISGKERKEFLQKILNERMCVTNKYSSDIERTKLNQLLSRTQEEWKVFEEMDKQQEFMCLLTQAVQLPEWLEEITTKEDAKEVLPSKRKRKQMTYNDDAYWKSIEKQCVEAEKEKDDDKENKKKPKRKRKRKLCEKDEGDDDDDAQQGNANGAVRKKK
eukprot:472237_1